MPSASRLSATKLRTSPTTSASAVTALATSFGSLVSRPVTEARFWFSCRIRSPLLCSADTRIDRFFTVLNRSLLWSPSAETACESFMMVSRMVTPWPRRLFAAVVTSDPRGLTPPWVGCSIWVSFSRS